VLSFGFLFALYVTSIAEWEFPVKKNPAQGRVIKDNTQVLLLIHMVLGLEIAIFEPNLSTFCFSNADFYPV